MIEEELDSELKMKDQNVSSLEKLLEKF